MTLRIEPLITVKDLDNYPDDGNRYELVGGKLFVSGAPDILHQLILQEVLLEIAIYLKEHPVGKVVPGVGTILSNYDFVIPDIAFVRIERWKEIASGEWLTEAPDIVVEVLSSGVDRREFDLQIKRQLYAKYGVEEYWIVDYDDRSIAIYRLQNQTLAKVITLRDDDVLNSPLLPGFKLTVRTVFKY